MRAKKQRITAQRIASCERIMQAFHSAHVIFTTKVADGTNSKCVIRQLSKMEDGV